MVLLDSPLPSDQQICFDVIYLFSQIIDTQLIINHGSPALMSPDFIASLFALPQTYHASLLSVFTYTF